MLELIGLARAAQSQALPDKPGLTSLLTPFSFENFKNPSDFAISIITILVFVAGALAVAFLIYGGILYITAGGDAEKATKGKTAVINSVIGIIIVLLALIIINWVKNFVSSGGTTY